jgi:hypothetical protein
VLDPLQKSFTSDIVTFRLVDVIQQCNQIFGGRATLSAVALDGSSDVFEMGLTISDTVVQLGEGALESLEQTRNHEYQLNVEVWELFLQEGEIVYIGSEAVDSNNKKLDNSTRYLIGSLEETETLQ